MSLADDFDAIPVKGVARKIEYSEGPPTAEQAAYPRVEVAGTAADAVKPSSLADEFDAMPVPSAKSGGQADAKPADVKPVGLLGRTFQGMRDPADAMSQIVYNTLPASLQEKWRSLANWGADKTGLDGRMDAGGANAYLKANEEQYQARRLAANGGKDPGFDGARLLGNAISPANALLAATLPETAPVGLAAIIGRGAVSGLAGGLLNPVVDGGDNFWREKITQGGIGTTGGAVLAPILSKLSGAISTKIAAYQAKGPEAVAQAAQQADAIIADALKEINHTPADLSPAYMQEIKAQVLDSLKSGKKIDAAALLRKNDFEKLGMEGTLGQITRDAGQYATERNLRGVAGVGEPLLERFGQQNKQLSEKVGEFGGNAAKESFGADTLLYESLKNADEGMQKKISAAYNAARASSGKDMDVPLTGLAQDYASTLKDFAEKIPGGVRNRFEELGLLNGKQMKTFSVEDAEGLLKVINSNASNDPATNAALGVLRNAVKKAVVQADDAGGVFAGPRSMAAARFQLHEAVPALEKASISAIAPDGFVNKYVLNGNPTQVQSLAAMLRKTDPAAFDEARNQIGAKLQRAAFGENPAGDAGFNPAAYAKALRGFGTDRLKAFFNNEEIDQMQAVSRVGAYMKAMPNDAPVSTSNSGVPVVNSILGVAKNMIPGAKYAAALVNTAKGAVNRGAAVDSALAAEVPATAASAMTPEQQRRLARGLLYGSSVGGALSGPRPN